MIDHAGIDVSGAFSIHWDPSETGAGVVTASRGGVNSIRLGSGAFANYRTMVTTIRAQLATASPTAAGTPVAARRLADPNLHAVLIATNQSRLPQVRSIRTIQSSVGAPVTGRWDLDTVRHIAAKQQASGAAAPGGLLEEATIEAIGRDLLAAQQFDAVLYLILDYYRFDTSRRASNVRYEPVQALSPRGTPPLAETKFTGWASPAPWWSTRRRRTTVARPRPHARARARAHRADRERVASEDVREFLSEGIKIVSHGMPEEGIETPADIDGMLANSRQPASLAFVDDVLTMLRRWTPCRQQRSGRIWRASVRSGPTSFNGSTRAPAPTRNRARTTDHAPQRGRCGRSALDRKATRGSLACPAIGKHHARSRTNAGTSAPMPETLAKDDQRKRKSRPLLPHGKRSHDEKRKSRYSTLW